MASTKPPYEEDSSKRQHIASATSGNRRGETGWAEKVTASKSVQSVYLSLTTHLTIAIILTLWAITPENQSTRLSPVIIDFGTELENEWGETNGDDNTATVLTEVDKKDDPSESPVDRHDLSEEVITPDENQIDQQMQAAAPEEAMIPDSTVPNTTPIESPPIPRTESPKENQFNNKTDGQMGGGTTARASTADAKVALSQRSGAARGETARARGGSPASEAAIERGLLWLARHQAADGSWSFENPHCKPHTDDPEYREYLWQLSQTKRRVNRIEIELRKKQSELQRVLSQKSVKQNQQVFIEEKIEQLNDELADAEKSLGQIAFRPSHRCKCQDKYFLDRTNPNKFFNRKGYLKGHTKASTSIALLAFLGAGNTHLGGPYQEVVYRGLEHLKATLDIELRELNTDIPDFTSTFSGNLYGYGITALVMAEAFGMTGDPDLERYVHALSTFLIKCQHVLGGWRYSPNTPGDITVTGWQIVALKSCQITGSPVGSDIFDQADKFLDSLTWNTTGDDKDPDPTQYRYLATKENATECTSAVGLLCRLYTGWNSNDPRLLQGVKQLLDEKKTPPPVRALQLYRNFYLAQILLHIDHPEWKAWNQKNRDYLVREQVTKQHIENQFHPHFGYPYCEIGSWYLINHRGDPKNKDSYRDRHLAPAGRLAHTALAILTLEVYYRLLPIYKPVAIE